MGILLSVGRIFNPPVEVPATFQAGSGGVTWQLYRQVTGYALETWRKHSSADEDVRLDTNRLFSRPKIT